MWKFPFFVLFFVLISAFPLSIRSDLIISKVDRTVDLTSHIVRAISSLKVENNGPGTVSEVLLAIPNTQAKNLAYLKALYAGKGKGKGSSIDLQVEISSPKGMPAELTFYSVSLPKELEKGESFTFAVLSIFTRFLVPFPEKITQDDTQLLVYQDSAYYLSPYYVKSQTLSIRLPSKRVESYTTLPNGKLVDSEIRYGPFDNILAFSYSPVVVHFENNHPFAIGHELLREIEISHWGNVQVTEHYTLVHGGAQNKGGFSRFDYQSRMSGVSSIRNLIAGLPPRAHSVYYRDEIGNISTSHLWGDSKKTQLAIEPRFPIFGGWKTFFTIGYGLPLEDFLFNSEGKRFLNITFGSPFSEIAIDNIIVKVVLPEGSKEISVSAPFPTVQRHEVKLSHLDISGRPVVVLEKSNVVPEHNQYFQIVGWLKIWDNSESNYCKFQKHSKLVIKRRLNGISTVVKLARYLVKMHISTRFSSSNEKPRNKHRRRMKVFKATLKNVISCKRRAIFRAQICIEIFPKTLIDCRLSIQREKPNRQSIVDSTRET